MARRALVLTPAATRVALVAAAVAGGGWRGRRHVPGGVGRWERTNHRGRPVSLLEGPAWALGAGAGLLAADLPPRVRAGALAATLGAAAFGVVDDLAGSGSAKGLRGHLGELGHGHLTTGGLKVLGIGASGLLAAGGLLPAAVSGAATTGRGRAGRAGELAVAGMLVAGTANLANLLDLRPGRVLKIVTALAPLAPGDQLVAAAAGASAALVGPDLDEAGMLGDSGANAAGALLGAALVVGTAGDGRRGRLARAAALTAVVAVTLASERVSFTQVIDTHPVLRRLDALGRRPAPS